MEINTIYGEIIKVLKNGGHEKIINDLSSISSAGSTGSEIVFAIGKYLFELRQSNIAVYRIIKDEIDEYLKTCEQQGVRIV